jgi:hypothetical protein
MKLQINLLIDTHCNHGLCVSGPWPKRKPIERVHNSPVLVSGE